MGSEQKIFMLVNSPNGKTRHADWTWALGHQYQAHQLVQKLVGSVLKGGLGRLILSDKLSLRFPRDGSFGRLILSGKHSFLFLGDFSFGRLILSGKLSLILGGKLSLFFLGDFSLGE